VNGRDYLPVPDLDLTGGSVALPRVPRHPVSGVVRGVKEGHLR